MGILSARDRRRSREQALLKAGDMLAGKYRVDRLLGEGGMGMVVAAHHVMLDQRVAIKLLYADDEEAVGRLLDESRRSAKLGGEHVVRVIDVDIGENGLPFIVMELLAGSDLGQMLASRGPLPRWQVVDYVLQALEGLTEAHVRGIIHRDLKPSNLFVAERPGGGEVLKVLDFGVSKSVAEISTQSFTGASSVLGSPPYMSPEQVRSPKLVDLRTDIWSMGIVMYELLTGRLPFQGEELQATFAQILEKEIPPIRGQVNGVPEGLERIIMKCLARDRGHRYATVLELARDLTPYGSGGFTSSKDRIAALFAKPMDELSVTGPHGVLAGTPPVGTPLVAPEGMHADFAPTASTVIGRRGFVVNETRSRGVVLAMVAGLLVALALMGAALLVRSKLRRDADIELPADPQAATDEPLPLPPLLPATGAAAAGLPPPPVATDAPPAAVLAPPPVAGPQTSEPTAQAPAAASAKVAGPKAPQSAAQPPRKTPQAPAAPPASSKPKLPTQLIGRD